MRCVSNREICMNDCVEEDPHQHKRFGNFCDCDQFRHCGPFCTSIFGPHRFDFVNSDLTGTSCCMEFK
jgi:hypothetical protein